MTVERWTGNFPNQPYATVTICIPGVQGANQCATIDHMLIDTGSAGVRVLASALGSALAGRLPAQTGATDDPTSGAPISECTQFLSGYTWGPIKRADVTIGGKVAGNLPIQVISDGAYAVPSDCLASGLSDLGTANDLGANGVIGISPAVRDWPLAAQYALSATYYYCPSKNSCKGTRVPLDTQVMNPVANFTSDNNGTIIRLPALPSGGQASVTGELVFGIGTQQNNALPSNANIIPLDGDGFFTTVYKGGTFVKAAIDSGSNTNTFRDATIPVDHWDRYTPSTTLSLSAALKSGNGATAPVTMPFQVANMASLMAGQYAAHDDLGVYTSSSSYFIWGLPLFYGRNVYTALNGSRVGTQTGPFVAF
ncbi:DUF3443 domain-containing protein [Paraburkholderia sp. RL17-337-BIB-A]|uniref:DUF3443 domain-containing protein n=1 Tax=Paraburkholderia sp. RL17-337-BIB-A TaxID=3031636 RepID=UPI0038BA9D45